MKSSCWFPSRDMVGIKDKGHLQSEISLIASFFIDEKCLDSHSLPCSHSSVICVHALQLDMLMLHTTQWLPDRGLRWIIL